MTLNSVPTVAHGGTYNRQCLHLQLVPGSGFAYGFIRDEEGEIGWIRLNNRIAKKDPTAP